MTLEPGTRFGAYEITGQLGKGGMGEVYRATDTKLGREVAIKTLPASLADDQDRLARFEREAKLLATLNHAHIASVYNLDEEDGTLYISMELVEGETLEEKLKRGPLPVDDALQLALQIALALEAAHDKGVVHRDLKPANVMITPDGVVKVLDFGLAKAFSGDPNDATPAHSPALSLAMTQAGLVLGTAGYMSPEQASGQATDQRADVWSFGVVVYEMLTGQPLFHGETVPHILAAVLQNDPDWTRLPQNLHPRLRDMLRHCLAKKPRSRYHSIADARIEIEEAVNDPSATIVSEIYGTTAAAAGQAAGSAPAWRRALPWVAGLALAVVAGAAAWTVREPAPPPVIRAVHPMPDDPEYIFPASQQIAIAPAGDRFIYNLVDGTYIRRMNAFESLEVPGLSLIRGGSTFSPDGESVAMLMGGRAGSEVTGASAGTFAIVTVPVGGGAPLPITTVDFQPNDLRGIDWTQEGWIVYASNETIWRVPENGGEAEALVTTELNMQHAAPELLPGGEWLLYSLGPRPPDWDGGQILVESLVTGERRLIRSGGSHARFVPTGHLVYLFGNVLFAAPFDAGDPQPIASPVQVVQGIQRNTFSGIGFYDFSLDGTLIYVPGGFSDQNRQSLAIVDRSRKAIPYPMPPGAYGFPRVSPDGRWAAFSANYQNGFDIAVHELGSTATPQRRTFGGTSSYPLWSADGTHIVFQSTPEGREPGLYRLRADGTQATPEQLTTAGEGEAHYPDSFSPDGTVLTYTVESRTGSSIRILDLETNEDMPLFTQPGVAFSQSVFSPDGEWIAYQSTETGEDEIFVQRFPPTGAKFQLEHTLENHHPAWSADGTELFYFPGPGRFESVRITTEPNFSFSAATVHTSPPMNDGPQIRRRYDVMPDGSGFLGFVAPDDPDAESLATINIVYNWFEELKARVPVD